MTFQTRKCADGDFNLAPVRMPADGGRHVFCGYYDLSAFDTEDRRLLALRYPGGLETPPRDARAQAGFYDLQKTPPVFIPFAETLCWNWQQGSRMRWWPAMGSDAVVYNDVVDGRYATVFADAVTGKRLHTLPRASYEIHAAGKYALSLDFSRLHRLRPGYGYGQLPDTTAGCDLPDDNGIWSLDLTTGKERRLFSLRDLAAIVPDPSMDAAEHYINHISMAPDGKHFVFFHLWLTKQAQRRYSRLFLAKANGSGLTLLNHRGHVSHYTWLDNHEVLVTTFVEEHRMRYVCYRVDSGAFSGIIGLNELDWDGHPSILAPGILITDTYPDEKRDQYLVVYERDKRRAHRVARWNMPLEFKGEVRCDLHPNVGDSGRRVAVNIVHQGRRAIAILETAAILERLTDA